MKFVKEIRKYLVETTLKGGHGDFEINQSNGEIRTVRPLDREKIPFYWLLVHVSDGVLTSSGFVEVYVDDVNDNSPHFEESSYTADVRENLSRFGFVLLDVLEIVFYKLKFL